ncbi:MAG: hypothetical protein ACXAEU_08395 [Candidatus Hodarchaeales archaeon]
MASEDENNKDSTGKLMVKTPWGKLITSKGIEKILEGFLKDIESQNQKLAKLENSAKMVGQFEVDIMETKDNSLKTKRVIKQLLEKLDADEKKQERIDKALHEFPNLILTIDDLKQEFKRLEGLAKELTLIKDQQEKHAKRIDAIFDTLVSLMEKLERIEDKQAKNHKSVAPPTLADKIEKASTSSEGDRVEVGDQKSVELIDPFQDDHKNENSPIDDIDIKTAIIKELKEYSDDEND